MPILLGVAASLLLGVADALGRAGARRASPISHVCTAMLAGSFVAIGLSLVLQNTLLAGALFLGAISGLFVSVGLSVLYHGMAQESAAVVAPPAAVFAALVPFVWGFVDGARPSPMAVLGCVFAIAFLGLSTYSPDPVATSDDGGLPGEEWIEGWTGRPRDPGLVLTEVASARKDVRHNGRGLLWGVFAGIMLGIGVIFVANTASESGAWPAAAQRVAGFGTMAVVATRQRVPLLLPKTISHLGILSGVAGTLGIICLVFGVQQGGDLGLVSVAGSMFPAVAILLANMFDGDTIRWWQVVGIVGSIVGVSMIVVGQ